MMKVGAVLRVARPTDHLAAIAAMYATGLDFTVLAEFHDHDGFDGIILGHPHQPYHLEFTTQRGHQVGTAPTQDHLLVFYFPDQAEWEASCARMLAAGFQRVPSYNPYSVVVFWLMAGQPSCRYDRLLLGEHIGKDIFSPLSELESLVGIQDQRLYECLRLLATRFPDGFEG